MSTDSGSIRPLSFAGAKPTVPEVTGRGRHRLRASVLVAVLCAACGGGGETRQRSRHAPRRRAMRSSARAQPISTPAAPATTTTTTAAPRRAPGFADGVPAPHVVDRGRDYVAIARSLVAYGRWLEWHDPDPALVDARTQQLSDLAQGMARPSCELHSRREHIEEVDAAPSTSRSCRCSRRACRSSSPSTRAPRRRRARRVGSSTMSARPRSTTS